MGGEYDGESSPSAWRERVPLLCLAVVGLLISTYLSLVQIGVLPHAWDPIFGSASSDRVLRHSILAPLPDAILGMLGYCADIVFGALGGKNRWRTWPTMTLLFGLVIFGIALVSVMLILLQSFYMHTWCMLCLCSALISLVIFGLGIHEPLATLGYQLRHLLYEPPRGFSAEG